MKTTLGRNPILYQARASDGRPFCVYRLYDHQGVLLYVGASRRVSERLTEHAKSKSWWSEVEQSSITTTWYGCVVDASNAEEIAIESENPKYNIAGKHTLTNGYRNSRGREKGCFGQCEHSGNPTVREMRMTTTTEPLENTAPSLGGNAMLELRLLELQAEYTNHASNEATALSLGLETDRTREDIAREYGQALRAFLNG